MKYLSPKSEKFTKGKNDYSPVCSRVQNRSGQVRCTNLIPDCEPRRRSTARMAGDRRPILARGQIHRDGHIGLRSDREIQRIRDGQRSVRDYDRFLSATESDRLQGRRLNGADSS